MILLSFCQSNQPAADIVTQDFTVNLKMKATLWICLFLFLSSSRIDQKEHIEGIDH